MRYLFYILFLIGFVSNAQVNVWTYDTANGGNNNGTIEQSEFQAALDNEASLIVTPAATITLTSLVALDQIAIQTIDFNGSIIEKNFITDYALWVNKSGRSGANTTISNLEIDGNSNHGSLLYSNSRLNLENVELHHAVENTFSGGPRGLFLSVTNNIGVQGEWLFNNVNIHDIRNDARSGVSQPGTGFAAAMEVVWSDVVGGAGMQLVYLNSTIQDIWGDEGDGFRLLSPLIDISNTNNTLWFENVTIKECERRAAKVYIGNTTWVNCNIHAVDRTNPNIDTRSSPAGLFNIGARSSAQGSNNNLVCGTIFHAAPSTPNDAWETQIGVISSNVNGASCEFRNCTFESGDDINTSWGYDWAGINLTGNITGIKICNSSVGIASTSARGLKLNKDSGFTLQGGGKIELDSNNSYTNSQAKFVEEFTETTEYVISDLSGDCATCPTYGLSPTTDITGIKFVNSADYTIHVNENVTTPFWKIEPITDETGQTYTYTRNLIYNDYALYTISNDTLFSTVTYDYENPVDTNTNNIYSVYVNVSSSSGDSYEQNMVIYVDDVVEGGEVYVTAIAFDDDTQTILVGEFVNKAHTFTPASPTNTGVSYYSDAENILGTDGLGLNKGTVITFTVLANDTTNGFITDLMTVNVNPDSWQSSKLSSGRVKTSGTGGKIQIGK